MDNNKSNNIDKNIKKNIKIEGPAKLGTIKKINIYEDIFKQIEIQKILNAEQIDILLEDKPDNFTYATILAFLDDIISKFWTDIEEEILIKIFEWHLGYKISFSINSVEPEYIILDFFSKNNAESLSTKERELITSSSILPIRIKTENKINKLVFISRTPETPKDILSLLKEILKREKIKDWELILVTSEIFSSIKNNLQDQKYDFILED